MTNTVNDVMNQAVTNQIPSSPSAYIFCVIALLIQPCIAYYVFRKQDKNQAALKVPMLSYSVVYFIVQIFVFWKYLRRITGDMQVYAYIIQAAILIIFVVVELAFISSNRYANRIENEKNARTADFKNSRKMFEIEMLNLSEERKKKIAEIADLIRYANPVSLGEVVEEDKRLEELINGLSKTDDAEFDLRCDEMKKVLIIRKMKQDGGAK